MAFNEETGKFTVTSHDLSQDESNKEEEFDFVINCSGHFSLPNIVALEGIHVPVFVAFLSVLYLLS